MDAIASGHTDDGPLVMTRRRNLFEARDFRCKQAATGFEEWERRMHTWTFKGQRCS